MASHKVYIYIQYICLTKDLPEYIKNDYKSVKEKSDNPTGKWSGNSNWHFTQQTPRRWPISAVHHPLNAN